MERIYQIAINTYRESIRSKLLYSVLFFAIAIVLISAFFGTVSIGDQVKIIKDFGLFSMSFFSVAYAVIAGASLLQKELARRTIFNILAKPVARWEFLCGKYFGMLLTVILMLALMGSALLIFCYFFNYQLDLLMLQSFIFIFLQLIIICAFTIFFSSIVVTPMLSGAFSFAVFLAGRSTEYLLQFVQDESLGGGLESILEAAYWLLPHLNKLDLSNQAVYGQHVSLTYMFYSAAYACGYAAVLLVLANFIFKRRDFN